MGYRGRVIAIFIVAMFNVLRYFYYHQYMGIKFELSFFILTTIFLAVAYLGGKQYDLTKFYAERDPLTNTYNRRIVEKMFNKKVVICKNNNQKLGIVIIDLNKFKDVNDKFGHRKGDEVLKYVANVIKENAKKDDVIVRWGGDEFVHIIPNIQEDYIVEYIEKLNNKLRKNEIASIEASVGVAIYPKDGDDFEALIQNADTEMYEMKANPNHDSVINTVYMKEDSN